MSTPPTKVQGVAGKEENGADGSSEATFLLNISYVRLSFMSPVLSGFITAVRTWKLDKELSGTGMVK